MKKLNFLADRHHAAPGIRHLTKSMEKEHRRAEEQIALRNAHPQDDPLMRSLLEDPNLLAYQYEMFGSQDAGAGPSHGAAPSQVKEESFSWDEEEEFDMSDDRFWENVAKLAEDDEAKEAEEAAKKARGG